MNRFTSLKVQLLRIILAVTAVSTVMSFTFNIIYDYFAIRNTVERMLQYTSLVMSEQIASLLTRHDQTAAEMLLEAFRTLPEIEIAVIYDGSGNRFAGYCKDVSPLQKKVEKNMSVPQSNDKAMIRMVQSIGTAGAGSGKLVMLVSKRNIATKMQKTLVIYSVLFSLIILVTYCMAERLQRSISQPLMELKNLSEKISEKSDYSIRIPITQNNEIGLLEKSIDQMVVKLHHSIQSLKNEIDYRISIQNDTSRLRTCLQNILNSISSAIIATDKNGVIGQVNNAAVSFLSEAPENLANRHVLTVLPLNDGREQRISACLENNSSDRFFVESGPQQQGDCKHLEVEVFPLSKVSPDGLVIVVTDVTDRVRIENLMMQNEKMMSLGGLAAGMAHEINNPLGIISMGIQHVLRNVDPDIERNQECARSLGTDIAAINRYLDQRKALHYLDGMLAASKRAGDIVSNMLHFSRMGGTAKIRVDMCDLVDHTVDLAANEYQMSKRFDFRNIRITRDYDAALPDVNCNAVEIQQVILNLLQNAAHALHEKKGAEHIPEIIIRIKNAVSHVRIEVEDNGSGIPEHVKNRVFEPFFTTKEVGVGTGLGLSVAFFIITKNHAGTITFRSNDSEGTCFIVTLPLETSTT